MGLDMYLNKKYYVKNWGHTPKDSIHKISIKKGGKKAPIPTDKISYVETQEIQWRKANAIHKWFVDHCQGGVDDCRQVYVSSDKLRELLAAVCDVLGMSKLVPGKVKTGSVCENGKWTDTFEEGMVIEDPTTAQQLLPTAAGCFFGSYDYDQWYLDDLTFTKKELERILNDDDEGDFFYQSSW